MSDKCRAKEPSKCRHHGNAEGSHSEKMNQAVKGGDISTYLQIREEVEKIYEQDDQDDAPTTEESVRSVLGVSYDKWSFQKETALIANIAEVMDSPENQAMGEEGASLAAEKVHHMLWDRYRGGYMGGAAAAPEATCNLFYSLERQDELGWIAEDAGPYTAQSHNVFNFELEKKEREERAQKAADKAAAQSKGADEEAKKRKFFGFFRS